MSQQHMLRSKMQRWTTLAQEASCFLSVIITCAIAAFDLTNSNKSPLGVQKGACMSIPRKMRHA